jgi:hypothetical protein
MVLRTPLLRRSLARVKPLTPAPMMAIGTLAAMASVAIGGLAPIELVEAFAGASFECSVVDIIREDVRSSSFPD